MSKLDSNTAYTFRVRDFNSIGPGSYSKIVSTSTFPAPLATPTLSCSLSPSKQELTLEWNAKGADSFEVQMCVEGSQKESVVCHGKTVHLGGEYVRVWLGAEPHVSLDVSRVNYGCVLLVRVRCRGTKDSLSPFSAVQRLNLFPEMHEGQKGARVGVANEGNGESTNLQRTRKWPMLVLATAMLAVILAFIIAEPLTTS